MITIKLKNDTITISGHAGFSNLGEDIVCASVSSIINTTVNSIKAIDENAIDYIDDGNTLTIKRVSSDNITQTLLNVMISILHDLSNQYPKNVELKEE